MKTLKKLLVAVLAIAVVMTAAIVDKIHGTETFRMEYFVNL